MQSASYEIDVHALAKMRAAGDAHTVLDIRERHCHVNSVASARPVL